MRVCVVRKAGQEWQGGGRRAVPVAVSTVEDKSFISSGLNFLNLE